MKFTETGRDYRWEVLKFMQLGNPKFWVLTIRKKDCRKLNKMIEASHKHCVCFAKVIFQKVRQLNTKSSKIGASRCGLGPK